MKRRDILKTSLAGPAVLAAPRIARAAGTQLLKFIPQSDLSSLDPIWTTADVTRNHGFMVFDTLYGVDNSYQPHPQMAAGHTTSADGKQWDITLREGLRFHDNTPVRARDCVASLKRWAEVSPFGGVLMARHRRAFRAIGQGGPFPAEEALPAAAQRARHDRQHGLHHAGATGTDAGLPAGHRDGGQRPVPLHRQRTDRRRARGIREIRRLRAHHRRPGGVHGGTEDRAFRPRGLDRLARPRHQCLGHVGRRVRLVGTALHRPHPPARPRQEADGDGEGPQRGGRMPAVQLPLPAVRQSGDPPRRRRGGEPARLHGGGRRG